VAAAVEEGVPGSAVSAEPAGELAAKDAAPAPEAVAIMEGSPEESESAVAKRGYPISPDEVSAAFLSESLGETVASFECDASNLEAGVLADAFRVALVYADPAAASAKGLPAACFFKVTKSIAEVADISASVGHVYEKEVYFYKELVKQVEGTIRVPKCYGVFTDASDPSCREFCILMEAFEFDEWRTFDQFKTEANAAPMAISDLESYLDFLAQLHSCTWDIPVDANQHGLGDYKANWHDLCAAIVGQPPVWESLQADWKALYGQGMLEGHVEPAVAATVGEIMELMTGPQGMALDAEILRLLRTRPRALTHGDARGNNIFRKKGGKQEWALIDWQMWAAGAVANEFPQVFLNSFSVETGVMQDLDSYLARYHAALCAAQPKAAASYSLEDLTTDVRLSSVDMFLQYVVITNGFMEGYKDPANKAAADYWNIVMRRNCETLHFTGALEPLKALAAKLT
jgi:hypothetical protein